MKEKPATQAEILALMEQGWELRHGSNWGGQWWLKRSGDGGTDFRKVHSASAQALLRRGKIYKVASDFHRGDTFALTVSV